ncbi:MAG: serine protease [Acidobacteriota bacterium]|nr:serine protease [Acidobacteriota bacterium]
MPPIEIDDRRMKRLLNEGLIWLAESGEAPPPGELLQRIPETWHGVDVAAAPLKKTAPEEIYRSACQSVVAVGKLYLCSRCGKRHTHIASGFAIAKSGLVVTNFHVADDPEKLALGIMTLDGSVHPVQSIVRADRSSDLAILQLPIDDLVPLPLGDEPPVGAPIYVLSHPAGRLFTFTEGIVSRYVSHGRTRLMAVTADFARGSSGAPVLDAHGAVVGVARQTKSVYHHSEDDTPPRLQMVLKQCVPAGSLRNCLRST